MKHLLYLFVRLPVGEESRAMKTFWKCLLRKKLPSTLLAHLKYAVFDLGDSSYIKFNFVAKRLFKRLQQLGAHPITALGLGDDQHELGYEAAADPWLEDLCRKMLVFCPLPFDIQPLPKNICLKPRWNVTTFLSKGKSPNNTIDILFSTKIYQFFVNCDR